MFSTAFVSRIFVPVAYIMMLAINAAANMLLLNGRTTGGVSNSFLVYFKPAGYVFAIWGVIYLLLGGFVLIQALPSRQSRPELVRVRWLFMVSCVFNGLWLVSWHFLQFGISVLLMFALLAVLILIYRDLFPQWKLTSITNKIFIHLPFRVYLAWICVASIANTTVWLESMGFSGLGLEAEYWAVLMLAAGAIVLISVALPRGDAAFMVVFVWAYVGIGNQFPATAILAPTAFAMAWSFAGLMAAVFAFYLYKGRTIA
jgi:hypothetical protein